MYREVLLAGAKRPPFPGLPEDWRPLGNSVLYQARLVVLDGRAHDRVDPRALDDVARRQARPREARPRRAEGLAAVVGRGGSRLESGVE